MRDINGKHGTVVAMKAALLAGGLGGALSADQTLAENTFRIVVGRKR